MQITDIKESGANNILMWALANGANIKNDTALASLINDETFYLVTLSDVNALELFRLTQMYREKLRIINEHSASVPDNDTLSTLFPGEYTPDDPNDNSIIKFSNVAEHAIQSFMNISMQMMTDDDIINSNAVRLFLPMISRKVDVQFPVSFLDFISSITDEEYSQLFNSDYPSNLYTIIDSDIHSFKIILSTIFVKGTKIIHYDQRYDKYLKVVKYSPLKQDSNNKLYKFALTGFKKYDNIAKTEVKYSLFKPSQSTTVNILKRMKRINTPLEMEFVIQLPILYMQILLNSFGRDILNVTYESSMSNILENGIIYDDFKTLDTNESDDEETIAQVEEHVNQVNAYRVRITEANQVTLSAMELILRDQRENVDVTSAFAMLPSVYMTNAVITIGSDNIQKLVEHTDPILSEMFNEMNKMFNIINDDIRKA